MQPGGRRRREFLAEIRSAATRPESLGGAGGAAACMEPGRPYAAEGFTVKERAPQARQGPAAQRTSNTARRAAVVGRSRTGLELFSGAARPSPLCAGQPCDSWAVHIGDGESLGYAELGASSRNGINSTPRSLRPFPDLVHLTHLSAKSLRAGYTGTSLQGVLRSPVTARECPLSVPLAAGPTVAQISVSSCHLAVQQPPSLASSAGNLLGSPSTGGTDE